MKQVSGTIYTILYLLESYWFNNLGIFTEGNLLIRYISPSTWGNQQGARELSSSPYQRLPESYPRQPTYVQPWYFSQQSLWQLFAVEPFLWLHLLSSVLPQ